MAGEDLPGMYSMTSPAFEALDGMATAGDFPKGRKAGRGVPRWDGCRWRREA